MSWNILALATERLIKNIDSVFVQITCCAWDIILPLIKNINNWAHGLVEKKSRTNFKNEEMFITYIEVQIVDQWFSSISLHSIRV